jgi:rhodanese-related sulfurtransferase
MPGFAAVATVLAGESRARVRTFLIYDAIGALLWSGLAVAFGVIFHNAVNDTLELLIALGHYGALVVLAVVLGFVGWKWWQRRKFLRELRLARVSPAELLGRLQAGETTVILDVRLASHRIETGWIPGSIHVQSLDDASAHASDEVVVYCDCPNEASAAAIAVELRRRGFGRIRPLAGGFESWRDQGHPVDSGSGLAVGGVVA